MQAKLLWMLPYLNTHGDSCQPTKVPYLIFLADLSRQKPAVCCRFTPAFLTESGCLTVPFPLSAEIHRQRCWQRFHFTIIGRAYKALFKPAKWIYLRIFAAIYSSYKRLGSDPINSCDVCYLVSLSLPPSTNLWMMTLSCNSPPPESHPILLILQKKQGDKTACMVYSLMSSFPISDYQWS